MANLEGAAARYRRDPLGWCRPPPVWVGAWPRHDVARGPLPRHRPSRTTPTTSCPCDPPDRRRAGAASTAIADEPVVDDRPWYRRIDRKLVAGQPDHRLRPRAHRASASSRSVTGDEVIDLPSAIEDITPATRRRPGAPADATSSSTSPRATRAGSSSTTSPCPRSARTTSPPPTSRPASRSTIPPGVVFEPGNGTLTFTPGGDNPIDSFEPGSHTVQVDLLAHRRRRGARPLLHLVLRDDLS